MRKHNVNMLSGPITKGLFLMTLPIMVMNVMQSLFNIVDMAVLGNFADDESVGAVGACGMLITLCTSLLIGISAGANIVVAKRIGAARKDRVEAAVGTAFITAVIGGIVLMLIGIFLAEPLLRLTNCPESLLDKAVLYFKIYFYGVPVLIIYNFSAAMLRAAGDTKSPMFFLILGGIIKVILNICFITTLKMDVDGVGIATVISNLIVCVLTYIAVLRKKEILCFDFRKIKFNLTEFKEILFIGIPTGLQSALYSLANVVITAAVNKFGADATTGISIANQFDGILYQISCAPSFATIPYVAQNVGAGNIKRVKKVLIRAILITVTLGGTFGFLSAAFSGRLSSLMTDSSAVIEYSKQKMIIVSSTYFICGINEILSGVMRGLRKPILPTVTTLVFMCFLRFFWVYAVFPFYPNFSFLYLVWPIGWIASIIVLLIAYFPAISKLQRTSIK